MEWPILIGWMWISCGIVGKLIGQTREAAMQGLLLGLAFGPVGLVAALVMDGRHACRQCKTRFHRGAKICPACHADLTWHGPKH